MTTRETAIHLDGLLTECGAGSVEAFREFYERTHMIAHQRLFQMLGRDEDCEELLKVSYVRLWQTAPLYDRAKGRATTWLFAILRHHTINLIRMRAEPARFAPRVNEAHSQTSLDLMADIPRLRYLRADWHPDIEDCIARLGGRSSSILRLAYRRGLSYADIAQLSDTPTAIVKEQLQQALADLRECLIARGYGDI